MWTIAKIDKKNTVNFQNEIRGKFKDVVFYRPQFLREKIVKNKVVKFKENLFNDYIFCFHESFKNKNTIKCLQFTKGLKYFLDYYIQSQENIVNTIKFCKVKESSDGLIKEKFVMDKMGGKLKFILGPLRDLIFEINNTVNNKIFLKMGSIKLSVNKK